MMIMNCCFCRKKRHKIPCHLQSSFIPVCLLDQSLQIIDSNVAFEQHGMHQDLVNHWEFVKSTRNNIKRNYLINHRLYDICINYYAQTDIYLLVFHDISFYIDRVEQVSTILNSMLPAHIIDAVSSNNLQDICKHHENITVCFIDIKGFTSLCKKNPPEVIMHYLNGLYTEYDKIAEKYNVTKHEIIGDCYVAVSGVLQNKDGIKSLVYDHVETNFADNMILFASEVIPIVNKYYMPGSDETTNIRVGIHTGNVVSGIIDNKVPRFALFGDTMNIASRMETTAKPMTIHISEATYSHVSESLRSGFAPRHIDVKGIGPMLTYEKHVDLENTVRKSMSPENSVQFMSNVVYIANFASVFKKYDRATGLTSSVKDELVSSSASSKNLVNENTGDQVDVKDHAL